MADSEFVILVAARLEQIRETRVLLSGAGIDSWVLRPPAGDPNA